MTIVTRTLVVVATALALAAPLPAQPRPAAGPLTRAERTGYLETSRYDDVMAFLREVIRGQRRMHLTTFGYSFEGRTLPLVVVGDVEDGSPDAVLRSGKLRVFLQGNIHAGESEGKEALLMLLRDLAQGAHARWRDSLVLLVAPVLNADGTERVTLTNRPWQHGPVGGTGQRANAQGLDLNRDFAKLETPEVRSQVLLMGRYDPHVAVDLHTTDGTVHAYHVTYAEPLHPATDQGLVDLVRNAWFPAISAAVRAVDGMEFWFYGNAGGEPVDRGGGGEAPGWYTYDHRARYTANYWGLRNRAGILGETYAYATFEERVRASRRFVEELLAWAYANAGRVRAVTAAADAHAVVGESVAVRARLRRGAEVEVLLGEVVEERHPYTGQRMLRRTDARRPVRMPDYTMFEGEEWAVAPWGYVVPPRFGAVLDRLQTHGLRVTRLAAPVVAVTERFRVDSTWAPERPYQNHRERTVRGAWEPVQDTLPAGSVVVPVGQPLGRLAVLLLEPRSDDGLVTWNFFDDALTGSRYLPVRRAAGPL
jgi:hypothetical protein